MKTFFFILFLITSCTPEETSYEDSSPIVLSVDDEINKLKERMTASEIKVFKLEQDSIYQAKQISAQAKEIVLLKKVDSVNLVKINSEAAKSSSLTKRHERDSTLQWSRINPAFALIPKVSSLDSRYSRDSVLQWAKITPSFALIPKFNIFKTTFTSDSTKQWFDINKLKSASPVVQIPIMQADIKNIKAKDVSQDKFIVAHTEAIKNISDTIDVLKITAGSDFGVSTNGTFQISPAGMKRIEAHLQQ